MAQTGRQGILCSRYAIKEAGRMRALRICLAAAVLLGLIASAGCGKRYYFSFKDSQSLTDGVNPWLCYGDGTAQFFSDGVALNDKWIVCPFGFRGDLTIKITYDLDVTEEEVIRFFFLLASDAVYPSDSYHGGAIYAGDPAMQSAVIAEKHYSSSGVKGYWAGIVPGLDRDGENVVQITKRGDRYTFKLNDELMADYVAELYFPGWFYIQIRGEIAEETYAGAMVVKDVTITYSGDIQEI